MGISALAAEDTGSRNTAFGYAALASQNYDGDGYNTAVGYDAGVSVTTGTRNTIMGGLAGDALTEGSNNVAIGYSALSTEDTGGRNVAIGYDALKDLNYDGFAYNIAVGFEAGANVTTGIKTL